jgi:glycosyltransferase involved in cell wall biosynthesis
MLIETGAEGRRGPEGANYAIVLCALEGEAVAARHTAEYLIRNSVAINLFIAAPKPLLTAISGDPVFSQFLQIELDKSSLDSAFRRAVRQFYATGFVFLRAGASVPQAWDLRLAWTAARHPGAAAVSPLISFTNAPASVKAEEIDGRCFAHSRMDAQEATVSPDCVFVTGEAASSIVREWDRLQEQGSFAGFVKLSRQLRFRHIMADHIYVDAGNSSHRNDNHSEPDHFRRFLAAGEMPPSFQIAELLAPRQLHVMHSWGGGLARWVNEYCRADSTRQNFILKSIGTLDGFGRELWLFRHAYDREPIQRWPLNPAIASTATSHDAYAAALAHILHEFGIENILVSSLIGHSLDVFRTRRPTAMVCHDFYPLCPALNITFGSLCRVCDHHRLAVCTSDNPHNRFFKNVPVPYWLDLRQAFTATMEEHRIQMIAPSNSVAAHYAELLPEVAGRFTIIPHGTRNLKIVDRGGASSDRLRVLIPGVLSFNKGLALLQDICDRLLEFADLFLVGAGAEGSRFEKKRGVTVVREYKWEDLGKLVSEIQPDIALLPSVVPETFSFTLQELFDMGIPTLATRIGSFADRIIEGENGFLCEPSADSILEALRRLDRNREWLEPVAARLRELKPRSVREMIDDYDRLLDVPRYAERSYFAPDTRKSIGKAVWTRGQIFWRAVNAPFTEQNSALTKYEMSSGLQTVTIEIPPLLQPSALRFDPAETRGVMKLARLQLSAPGGECVWKWNGAIAEISRAASSNIVTLNAADESGVLLCFTNEDPFINLPLHGSHFEALRDGGSLEADVQWLGAQDSMPILQAECKRLEHAECLEALLRHLEAESGAFAPESVDKALIDLQVAQKRVEELENSLSWKITEPLRAISGRSPSLLRLMEWRKK